MAERVLNRPDAHARQARGKGVPQIMPVEVRDPSLLKRLLKPVARPTQRLTRTIPNHRPGSVAALLQFIKRLESH